MSAENFQRHADPITVHMNRFFLRYLLSLHKEFDGDLVSAIVLGEIGHHNVCQVFTSAPAPSWRSGMESDRAEFWEQLVPCNAFSVSAATGIPRETVRRKVARLVRKGWVKRGRRGELTIRPAVRRRFMPEYNLNMLNTLLRLADELRAMLVNEPGASKKGTR